MDRTGSSLARSIPPRRVLAAERRDSAGHWACAGRAVAACRKFLDFYPGGLGVVHPVTRDQQLLRGLRLLGTLDLLPGGVGILGLGSLAVAGVALLLARRDRLVLALAAGTGLLLLAALLLNYEPNRADLGRLEGHARNFALFALLIALGIRLAGLRPARWRHAARAAVVALIVWPTAVTPVRSAGLAVGNGIELANAQRTQQAPGNRFVLESIPSDRIADYIRNNTAANARVFSPHPHEMTYATGRPNAAGFAGLVHGLSTEGPEYRDVRGYLEPGALRRLGFEYVHAPDAWVESLPDEVTARLNDPRLFELLVRDGSESLYRVLPAFLALDAAPTPASFEALRQAIPASATVYLLAPAEFDMRPLMRTAWALSHVRLLGDITDRGVMHLLTPVQTEPLGDHVPDFVIAPAQFAPWMFPPGSRQPIWWNDETAVYALDGDFERIIPPRQSRFYSALHCQTCASRMGESPSPRPSTTARLTSGPARTGCSSPPKLRRGTSRRSSFPTARPQSPCGLSAI